MKSAEEEYYRSLINRLRNLPDETEWAEFRVNNCEPELIGEYTSALSDLAVYCDKEKAYLLWGINDDTYKIEGTKFVPRRVEEGNQELEDWLLGDLKPIVDFRSMEIETVSGNTAVMEVLTATSKPTNSRDMEYIRMGTYKKGLRVHPEKERRLWLSFKTKPFELRIVKKNISAPEVTELLDCAAYYTLMRLSLPGNRGAVIHNIADEQFIREMDNGNYEITNMRAMLFTKDLKISGHLKRKAIRVIQYKGNERTTAVREQIFTKGYATQLDDITDYIMTLIPQEEKIEGGRRRVYIMSPKKAVREMLGNAMIHQDLTAHNSGPMMKVFDAKVEASNLGHLLVDVSRIIDTTPHSRNESMALFLRAVDIYEERGNDLDRVEEGMGGL